MMRHRDIAGLLGPVARLCGAATVVLLALSVVADASVLKIPRDRPLVALDIPDDWSVERSSFAVEMRSPEKNSIIVASVLAGGRAAVDGWTKQAGERLKTFGVQFDANARAPAKPGEPPKSADATPQDKSAADAQSAFTTSPDAFTFSGEPSLKMPGTEGSNKPVKPAGNSIEGLTGFGTSVPAAAPDVPSSSTPKTKLPFHAVQIYGTTMNGKPVDVQVVIYTLPANRLFVMMQESGSDDGRAVALAQSVRQAD